MKKTLWYGFAALAMLAMVTGCTTLSGLKDDGMPGLAVYKTNPDPVAGMVTNDDYQNVVEAAKMMKYRITGQLTPAGRVAVENGLGYGVAGGAPGRLYDKIIPRATAAIGQAMGLYTGMVYFGVSAYGGLKEASCANIQTIATAVERVLRDVERINKVTANQWLHVGGVCIGTDNTSEKPGKALQAQMPEFSGRPAGMPVQR